MLDVDFNLPDDPKESLRLAIVALKARYLLAAGDWEVTLWGLVESGLKSHWQKTGGLGDHSGLARDQVIGLRRLSKACGGWFRNGQFIDLAAWLEVYRSAS